MTRKHFLIENAGVVWIQVWGMRRNECRTNRARRCFWRKGVRSWHLLTHLQLHSYLYTFVFISVHTVGETNLYDKKIIPRGLTTFSGHTRSGLHGNYQISSLWGCCHTNRFWKTAILLWKWKAFSSFSVFSLMEFFYLDVDIWGIKRCGIWWRIREMD